MLTKSLLFLFMAQVSAQLFVAYFDAQIDRIVEDFADKSLVDFSGVRVRKINKTRSIVGEVKFFKPLGNDVLIEIKLAKKQGEKFFNSF